MRLAQTSVVVALAPGTVLSTRPALAHCDTADGPVVADAKVALSGVAAGREFVEAYMEFTHYVERLDFDATTSASHGAGAPAAEHKH